MNTSTTLHIASEKKHSVRYDAPKTDNDPLVTTIYVMKGHLPRPFPRVIKITIEGIDA